jgi:hypothetical protein
MGFERNQNLKRMANIKQLAKKYENIVLSMVFKVLDVKELYFIVINI